MACSSTNDESTVKSKLTKLFDKKQPYENFDSRTFSEISQIPADDDVAKRIQGSLIGVAVGDALGASVEFRPHAYLLQNEVTDMLSGGTWGLKAGQWTDDTSMTLCLAASLIVKGKFDSYDQFVRYRKWYREGYLSSTGKCFDIGKATRDAITAFEKIYLNIESKLKDNKNAGQLEQRIKEEIQRRSPGLKFGPKDAAGNGPLMRLAPIPCFFFQSYKNVKDHIAEATQLTHDDPKAVSACQFYAGLIWHALNGTTKEQLLHKDFHRTTLNLTLHPDVQKIAEGSYKEKKRGYDDGIRGKGYIVDSLEAALWAFHYDEGKFELGVLKAVNLGDDTDTTAAIYGELAGAVYGIESIPKTWTKQLAHKEFIEFVAKALYYVAKKSKDTAILSDWSEDEKGKDKDYGDGTYQNRQGGEKQKADETHNKTRPNDGENKDGKRKEDNPPRGKTDTNAQNNNNQTSNKSTSAHSTKTNDASNGSNASVNPEIHQKSSWDNPSTDPSPPSANKRRNVLPGQDN